MWLAYTTLTRIHPHLAVQYQMCVIRQLPHVPLLVTTLWRGAPTSLWKCVFESLGHSLRSVLRSAMRTKRPYACAAIADAAFSRSCVMFLPATQPASPKQSCKRVDLYKFPTAFSLQLIQRLHRCSSCAANANLLPCRLVLGYAIAEL